MWADNNRNKGAKVRHFQGFINLRKKLNHELCWIYTQPTNYIPLQQTHCFTPPYTCTEKWWQIRRDCAVIQEQECQKGSGKITRSI
jgi:hypothetical protein